MNLLKRSFSVMLMLVLLVSVFTGMTAFAEDSSSTRWADAADEIDKYLDAAFESYLDGDAKTAYDNVSNAYFRVYETTGFERQTMSYVSGNRKNAVEMQFSTCKAAVKKDNTDLETKTKVRSALTKLKSMIREDGNKLAALQGGVQSEMKYYLHGELVSSDPYADFSADPNAAAKYENWYEAATLVKELLDTAYDERCKVVGRLAATGTGLDTAVYCNLSTMKTLLAAAEEKGVSHKVSSDESDDQISAIYVKVKDGYDIGQVNSKIQGHTRKCSAVRTKSMLTDVSDSLSAISGTVATLIGAIWLLALVILVVAFVMIANERKREFAVLRLLGTSRTMLGGMVLKESVLCSLAGGILGVLTASMLVFPFTTLIETSLGLPYLRPSVGTILALALASLAATVLAGSLASSWASFRLSRVDPGTVLREGN